MREGDCKTTKGGQTYCKEDGLVRFVGKGSRRRTKRPRRSTRSYRGMSGVSRRRGKMRKDECRITDRGMKYCNGPHGNRFVGRAY